MKPTKKNDKEEFARLDVAPGFGVSLPTSLEGYLAWPKVVVGALWVAKIGNIIRLTQSNYNFQPGDFIGISIFFVLTIFVIRNSKVAVVLLLIHLLDLLIYPIVQHGVNLQSIFYLMMTYMTLQGAVAYFKIGKDSARAS